MGGSDQQRRNHIDELLDRIEAERERIQQQLTQSQESHAAKAASARTLRLKRVWLVALWLAISLAILIRNVVRGHPRASAVTAVVGATALAVVLLPAQTTPRFPEAGAPTPHRATPTPTAPHGNPLAAAVQPAPEAPPQAVVALPERTPQAADPMLLLPSRDQRPIPPATPPTDPATPTPQPNQPQPPPSSPPSSAPSPQRPPVCLAVLPGVHVQLETCLSTVVGLLDDTTKGN